jgi:CTP:molybdopterin cytidylyltransferase MocA
MTAGIVLAAGASLRFGGVKQLATLDGRGLLERTIAAMSDVVEVSDIVVVLGANAQVIMQSTPMLRARVVICREWKEGQAASLRAGLQAVQHADAAVVTLGDEPLVGATAIRRVLAARDPAATAAVAATYDEIPGHPVLVERQLFDVVSGSHGDLGVQALLTGFDVRRIPCDDVAAPDGVDTPAELQRLRRSGASASTV